MLSAIKTQKTYEHKLFSLKTIRERTLTSFGGNITGVQVGGNRERDKSFSYCKKLSVWSDGFKNPFSRELMGDFFKNTFPPQRITYSMLLSMGCQSYLSPLEWIGSAILEVELLRIPSPSNDLQNDPQFPTPIFAKNCLTICEGDIFLIILKKE